MKPIAIVFTAILAILLLGISDNVSTTVPLEIESGIVFVRGDLNGIGPLLFVLDPGAGDFLTAYAKSRLQGSAAKELRIGGAAVPVAMALLPGDPDQLVPSHDPSRGTIAGSIGTSLLKHYALELDYAASKMTLVPLQAFSPPPHASRLPLTFDEYAMPVVEASVDGTPARFELDVRAPNSMLFPAFLTRSGIGSLYANAPVVKQSGTRVAHRLDTVSVGGTRVHAITAWFSNDSAGKFASRTVAGLLGNNVWSHFILTLDYRGQAAYIVKPGSRAAITPTANQSP